MLHCNVLTSVALDLLRSIQSNPHFSEVRLVGGTALALQIGHRRSIDLDFFGPIALPAPDLELELRTYGNVSRRRAGRRIQGFMVNGVQIDFVDYPYPWLALPLTKEGVRLATCPDIAAMKLAAITNRGSRKDFVDFFFLLARFSLPEMLEFYREKFADGALLPVLKSLVYFDDAEEDPMPEMLRACTWPEVKQRIAEAVAGMAC